MAYLACFVLIFMSATVQAECTISKSKTTTCPKDNFTFKDKDIGAMQGSDVHEIYCLTCDPNCPATYENSCTLNEDALSEKDLDKLPNKIRKEVEAKIKALNNSQTTIGEKGSMHQCTIDKIGKQRAKYSLNGGTSVEANKTPIFIKGGSTIARTEGTISIDCNEAPATCNGPVTSGTCGLYAGLSAPATIGTNGYFQCTASPVTGTASAAYTLNGKTTTITGPTTFYTTGGSRFAASKGSVTLSNCAQLKSSCGPTVSGSGSCDLYPIAPATTIGTNGYFQCTASPVTGAASAAYTLNGKTTTITGPSTFQTPGGSKFVATSGAVTLSNCSQLQNTCPSNTSVNNTGSCMIYQGSTTSIPNGPLKCTLTTPDGISSGTYILGSAAPVSFSGSTVFYTNSPTPLKATAGGFNVACRLVQCSSSQHFGPQGCVKLSDYCAVPSNSYWPYLRTCSSCAKACANNWNKGWTINANFLTSCSQCTKACDSQQCTGGPSLTCVNYYCSPPPSSNQS